MLVTELTRSWGLRHPIVSAPMVGVAGGALAGAVAAAGALGLVGVGGGAAPDWIAGQADLARPHGRFGLGLMLWVLERRPELIDVVLAQRPFAVWLSFGDPTPYVDRVRSAGARVLCQVQTAAGARRAAQAGVDAIVAQGTEAGGHTGSVGALPLLQIALEIGDAANVPVLAAGGIATGRALGGVLAMGSAGAAIGTRFAATAEALGTAAAKQRIVQAAETDTVHTHVFDLVHRAAWPDEYPGRALRNAFTDRWHGREAELRARVDEVTPDFQAAAARGDYSQAHVYAGQSAGLVHDLPTAGDLVRRLADEAEATLTRARSLVVPEPPALQE
ncbi:MAG: nitronate monooxygenase [Chloroflexi bacterium]|nr:nitronate monooxygenase [Chloroflexota bacterium]